MWSCPHDMDLKRLAYDLTMSTVEVEDATDLGASFHDMVVGEIRTGRSPIPTPTSCGSAKTDIGGGTIKDIVCGGTNLRDGMKVAVALPGAVCRWHGEGEPVEIKREQAPGRGELRHDLRRGGDRPCRPVPRGGRRPSFSI